MKDFVCHYCHEQWYVNDGSEEKVNSCPFCTKALFKPKEIIVTSIDTAILKIITDLGIDILNDSRKFFAYFSDVAYSFQKEKRILLKSCDDNVLSKFYDLSKLESSAARTELQKIEYYLVEEEGMSDIWAKKICAAFFTAIFPEVIDSSDEVPSDKNKTVSPIDTVIIEEKPVVVHDYNDIIFSFEQSFINQIKATFKGVEKYCRVDQRDIDKYSSISLPDDVKILFVNNVRLLPKNAFVNCKGLRAVCFGSKVIDIAKGAFIGCDALEYVLFPDDNKQLEIHDYQLVSSSDRKIYCSVKNHHLRGHYSWFKCYDFGQSSTEKYDINSIINFSRKI